jgi:hypothetical protein
MKTALIVVDGDLSFKLYSLNSFLYYLKYYLKNNNKKNNIKKNNIKKNNIKNNIKNNNKKNNIKKQT